MFNGNKRPSLIFLKVKSFVKFVFGWTKERLWLQKDRLFYEAEATVKLFLGRRDIPQNDTHRNNNGQNTQQNVTNQNHAQEYDTTEWL